MGKYLQLYRSHLTGSVALNLTAPEPSRFVLDWVGGAIRRVSVKGEVILDPVALTDAVITMAEKTGRLCIAVNPAGDSSHVMPCAYEDGARELRRLLDARSGGGRTRPAGAVCDVVGMDKPADLLGAIREDVLGCLADGGAWYIRVDAVEHLPTVHALGGAVEIMVLADGTIELKVAKPRRRKTSDRGQASLPLLAPSGAKASVAPANGATPTVACFFSGGGGLDMGAELAGATVAYANEIDPAVAEVYSANFSHVSLDVRDIREVQASQVPEADIYVGGFPCQPYSIAGKQLGTADHRAAPVHDLVRLIGDKTPKAVMLENVGNLAESFPEVLSWLVRALEKIGYLVTSRVLNSVDYGVPQTRERLIIMGIRKDMGFAFNFDAVERGGGLLTQREAFFDLRGKARLWERGVTDVTGHEYHRRQPGPRLMERNRVRRWGEPAFTIVADAACMPLHPDPMPVDFAGAPGCVFNAGTGAIHRRLSVREAARVQTFPDSYRFETESIDVAYRIVGNAVPVELSRRLCAALITQLGWN